MIPNLPTDNLYKFMALFGLLILVSYLVLFERVAWNAEISAARLEDMERQREVELRTYLMGTLSKAFSDEGLERVFTMQEIMEGMMPAIDRFVKFYSEMRAVEAEVDAWRKRQMKIESYRWWIVGAGISFVVAGFSLWWFKVQRYQDHMLRSGGVRLP